MKRHSIKNHILSYCAGSALLALAAASSGQAHPGHPILPDGRICIRHDSAGFPIWGHGPCGRPIYAYSPSGVPIYIIGGIYHGCRVPHWNPRPHYHGPCRPPAICRKPRHPYPRPARPCPPPHHHVRPCHSRPLFPGPPPRFPRHR